MKRLLRNIEKALLQYILLPLLYEIFCAKRIDEKAVLFADAKHDSVPYSMDAMVEEVQKRNYRVTLCCHDYAKAGFARKLRYCAEFMKQCSRVKYIFLCDYFLPASSFRKREEPKIIQLWHAAGLQKKFGYDAKDDLGGKILCNPVKNWDIVSVSGKRAAEIFAKAWKLEPGKVKALGFSRSDRLYDKEFAETCREKFYKEYPGAKNKTIILWAPTFRGSGADGRPAGVETIREAMDALDETYEFIIKMHPNMTAACAMDNCTLAAEELYPVTDILITDYSSVFYDALLLGKEIIFFLPDREKYGKERGLYIDYREEFEFDIAETAEELLRCIRRVKKLPEKRLTAYKEKFLEACDGHASQRIMDYLEGKRNGETLEQSQKEMGQL